MVEDEGPAAVRRPRFALSAPVPLDSQRAIEEAHAWLSALGDDAPPDPPGTAVRPPVWSSWRRAVVAGVDPRLARAPQVGSAAEVEAVLAQPRWVAAVDVVESMLVDDAAADGMTVALVDAAGMVVWTGGSLGMGRRAAGVGWVPGASWAETSVGTNAVGASLLSGACEQVLRVEHHLAAVRPFAGAAAPLRGDDGGVWGAVGFLGADHVATPAVLALVRFVAAALERVATSAPAAPAPDAPFALLSVLGRTRGLLRGAGAPVELSPRHTDLLLDLAVAAQSNQGRVAEELAVECWDPEVPAVTVRAEMHRLRRYLPGALLSSRPYQLAQPLQVDALEVLTLLRRGSHRRALDLYRGPLLPHSSAPVTVALRERVANHLRQALVAHAHVDVLLDFADTVDGDHPAVWQAVVDRLPPRTPRQTEARLRLAEAEERLLRF